MNIGVSNGSTIQTGALITGQGSGALSITAVNINLSGGAGTTAERSNTTLFLGTGAALAGGNLLAGTTSINVGGTAATAARRRRHARRQLVRTGLDLPGAGTNVIQTPALNVGAYKGQPGYIFLSAGLPTQSQSAIGYRLSRRPITWRAIT